MVFCLEISIPALQIIDAAGLLVNSGYVPHLGAQGNTNSKLRLKPVLLFYIVVTINIVHK